METTTTFSDLAVLQTLLNGNKYHDAGKNYMLHSTTSHPAALFIGINVHVHVRAAETDSARF